MAYVAVQNRGAKQYLALGLSVEEIEAFTSRPFRKGSFASIPVRVTGSTAAGLEIRHDPEGTDRLTPIRLTHSRPKAQVLIEAGRVAATAQSVRQVEMPAKVGHKTLRLGRFQHQFVATNGGAPAAPAPAPARTAAPAPAPARTAAPAPAPARTAAPAPAPGRTAAATNGSAAAAAAPAPTRVRTPAAAEEAAPHPANHVARLWTLVDKINRELRALPAHIQACISADPAGELRCFVEYATPAEPEPAAPQQRDERPTGTATH